MPTINNVVEFLSPSARAHLRIAGLRTPRTPANNRARGSHVARQAANKARRRQNAMNRLLNAVKTGRKTNERMRTNLNLNQAQFNSVVSILSGIRPWRALNRPGLVRSVIQIVKTIPNRERARAYFFSTYQYSHPSNLLRLTNTGNMPPHLLEGFDRRPPFDPLQVSRARALRLL